MEIKEIIEVINEIGSEISGPKDEMVEFKYQGTPVTLMYGEEKDRMRLMCAVSFRTDLTEHQTIKALEANFYSTLDSRYALSNGILFSVFTHSIKHLTKPTLISALDQVVKAKKTFGTEYKAGEISFIQKNKYL